MQFESMAICMDANPSLKPSPSAIPWESLRRVRHRRTILTPSDDRVHHRTCSLCLYEPAGKVFTEGRHHHRTMTDSSGDEDKATAMATAEYRRKELYGEQEIRDQRVRER
jgi:hypothetical protein